MKLKFKKQPYQSLAVSAVVDCFQGQPNLSGVKYRIDPGTKPAKLFTASGFKNDDLVLSASQILANIQRVQRARNLPQSQAIAEFKTIKKKGFVFDKSYSKKALAITPYHLDIEMETGTGKTYCYIKSFFELNKRFGWTKFIVVVPSIAIREGVYKSLETTADHFQETYGKKARFFIYNIPP